MSPIPEPMDDEDTNVVVAHSRRATRKLRLTVLGTVGVFAGLLVFWLASGPGSWEQRIRKHLGPEQPMSTAAAPKERMSCVVDASATTAAVAVTLADEGILWLDDTPLGVVTSKNLELSPGEHTIRAEIKRTDMRQVLTVKAGERFRLHFDRETKSIDLKCAGTSGL
jgi:hypothetical protein